MKFRAFPCTCVYCIAGETEMIVRESINMNIDLIGIGEKVPETLVKEIRKLLKENQKIPQRPTLWAA